MNCLFDDVATCTGSSSEHIIQRGLGGRHETKDVLCDACNHYFGQELDPGLCNFYQLLIDIIRPLMPSQFREITRQTTSLHDEVPLLRQSGGVVSLKKPHVERHEDGSVKTISMPAWMSHETRMQIAQAHGIKNPKFSYVPLLEVAPIPISKQHFSFQKGEHRAAAKAILGVLDWQTQILAIGNHARSPKLSSSRAYVRNGSYSEYIDRSSGPMHCLEDRFKPIFGTHEDDFSNCVLFCNDVQANRCYGFLQIAQTMPLGICLGEAVEDVNFSLLCKADLLGNEPRISRRVNDLLISYQDYKYSSFRIVSNESNEFAFTKMFEILDHELGRATTLIDLKDDETISGGLRQFSVDAIINHQASGKHLLRKICEPLLRMRFRSSHILEPAWQAALEQPEPSGFVPELLEQSIKSGETLGSQTWAVLQYYRTLIRLLVDNHGYPKLLTRL